MAVPTVPRSGAPATSCEAVAHFAGYHVKRHGWYCDLITMGCTVPTQARPGHRYITREAVNSLGVMAPGSHDDDNAYDEKAYCREYVFVTKTAKHI